HDDERRFLRTTGFVPTSYPRLVRTLIFDVRHGVLVVVGLGAAVRILVPIRIFRIVRAALARRRVLVGIVEDAVEIVVELGTTVVVEVAVLVFGHQDTRVLRVRQAVTIEIRIVRTTIVILVPVVRFGIARALLIE